MSKEALVVILDVSRHISINPQRLEQAKQAVSLLITNKLRYHPKDEMGLVLLGTRDTSNHLNDEFEDEYKHIKILKAIEPASVHLLRQVDSIKPSSSKADLIDALIVATDMIVNRTGNRKFKKRIFIVSDLSCGIQTSAELQDIIDPIKGKEIAINLIGINLQTEDEELATESQVYSNHDNIDKTFSEKVMRWICHHVSGEVIPIDDAITDMQFLRSKPVLQRPVFSGCLEITPDVKIPVQAFGKTLEAKFPSLSMVSKVAEKSEEKETLAVETERTYHCIDDPDTDVPKDQLVPGYQYGKEQVPFNSIDASQLAYKSEKCLQVLGFTEMSNVPRHHFMSSTYCFTPRKGDQNSQRALSALIRAMAETSRVAIVRYTFRAKANPKLGLLIPYIKSDYECLYYNSLPFVEDLRQYPFRSFERFEFSNEELQAADDLIDSMDLMEADEDEEGNPVEGLKPKNTFNPGIHYFYRCVHERSIHPDSEKLPEMDSVLTRFAFPEQAADGFFPRIMEHAAPHIQTFSQQFPVKKREREHEKGFHRPRHWLATTDDISLDSYNNATTSTSEGQQKEPEMNTVIEKNNQDQEMMAAKGSQDVEDPVAMLESKGVDFNQGIFNRGASHVGTVNPIKDFDEMFNRRDQDLVDTAIEEMQSIINKLVQDSIGDQYYDKALRCLIALRKGCEKEDEGDQFNKFLRSIKQRYSTGKRREFWNRIKSEGISLITEGEDTQASTQEAKQFLEDDNDTNATEDAEMPDADSEDENLFDMLE
eukprot:gb/GECH01002767.1/.p1 GENE.gb/GECH01002767.1/~~gb/GECH01002767.1/.p1  ORF type:complete len:765 (+),score=233.25 gb/GECH01002767.1/:1-2295(+)